MSSSLDRLKQSHDVHVAWRSFELRPPGAPPVSPEYRARIEAGRPRLMAIAGEHYGLELKPGPFGADSRPALIGAKAAEARGAGDAYHAAVLRAYWQQARPIDDLEVLAGIAAEAGLDRADFMAALDAPDCLQAVLADVEQAHAYGLNGVPALVFDQRYLVSGAQPYDVLRQVVERIAADQVG